MFSIMMSFYSGLVDVVRECSSSICTASQKRSPSVFQVSPHIKGEFSGVRERSGSSGLDKAYHFSLLKTPDIIKMYYINILK